MPEPTNPNSPVPSWVGGAAQPGGGAGAGGPQQAPVWTGAPTGPGAPGAGAPGGVAPVQAPAQTQPRAQGKAASSRPSGLVLAGAGSLLAVLAFLGGTAVGHAWGGSGATTPTQFGPGGGGRQFPGQQGQVPGQGTVPGQGQQGTVPGQGRQGAGQGQGQGQGTVPGTPGSGTQQSGAVTGQTKTT
ncbi:MAG: hypothetical protein QOH84_237 [Kribbellaceae bacterium]|nr:hypothetical protein [Kribbellaceae bacterium]